MCKEQTMPKHSSTHLTNLILLSQSLYNTYWSSVMKDASATRDQDSLGINCVLAASNFGPTEFCTDLLYNHASHPASALTLGESGDSHPPTSKIPKYVIAAFMKWLKGSLLMG